jgi:hypothetical protein
VAVPPTNEPVEDGVETKLPTVNVFDPEVSVMLVGKVMVNVLVPSPETSNCAAAGVPPGRDTPPVGVAVLSVPKTTVPAVLLAAIVPKSISTVLVMLIGVTRVAVAVAVADDWAKDFKEKDIARMAIAKILFFMLIGF